MKSKRINLINMIANKIVKKKKISKDMKLKPTNLIYFV